MHTATKPTLYFFVGYPGAGKTHVAKLIEDRTGAQHLWADCIRQERFTNPTHSRAESKQLYDELNDTTARVLASGKSVIFDTNFNFYDDRQLLRHIAADNSALAILIWVNTPKSVAHQRAVYGKVSRNGYAVNITEDDFERMAGNLQPPHADEHAVAIDGTQLDPPTVYQALNI
jgi:predicted kinase